jgi:hypothetical protein
MSRFWGFMYVFGLLMPVWTAMGGLYGFVNEWHKPIPIWIGFVFFGFGAVVYTMLILHWIFYAWIEPAYTVCSIFFAQFTYASE